MLNMERVNEQPGVDASRLQLTNSVLPARTTVSKWRAASLGGHFGVLLDSSGAIDVNTRHTALDVGTKPDRIVPPCCTSAKPW